MPGRPVAIAWWWGNSMGEVEWERARLFPISGIGGADEQERRAASALLAVIQSVREFGRAITLPMGAPAGRLSTFIEVPFNDGDKKLRPDGLIQVVFGRRTWTALVEVKTGRHELIASQIESYLDVARKHKFDALLTISNQVVATPGVHPVHLPKAKMLAARLHHLSWSQIRTEALIEQANKSVSDPDQAWILAEFIRYLEHPRSGAIDFDDMGPSWVHVRDRARTATLHPQDKGAADVADRFGGLISFAAMRLSRELGTGVRPMVPQAQLRDPARYLQEAVSHAHRHRPTAWCPAGACRRRSYQGHGRPASRADSLRGHRPCAARGQVHHARQLAGPAAEDRARPPLHRGIHYLAARPGTGQDPR